LDFSPTQKGRIVFFKLKMPRFSPKNFPLVFFPHWDFPHFPKFFPGKTQHPFTGFGGGNWVAFRIILKIGKVCPPRVGPPNIKRLSLAPIIGIIGQGGPFHPVAARILYWEGHNWQDIREKRHCRFPRFPRQPRPKPLLCLQNYMRHTKTGWRKGLRTAIYYFGSVITAYSMALNMLMLWIMEF